jgi:hypothetical protein
MGGEYWKTDEAKIRMSKIISKAMKMGMKESIAEGTRKYFRDFKTNNPGVMCPNAAGMWKTIKKHPEIIDKMQRSYNYGYFNSKKNGKKVFYQSSFELKACRILEEDENVISFGRAKTIIYYIDAKKHLYKPDYSYITVDGGRHLLEIKAQWFLQGGFNKTNGMWDCKRKGIM